MLLSHRRTGPLVGSFGGWFMNRDFKAVGEEALTPAVAHRAFAGFVYEEVESPHATLQFGGRLDHAHFTPEQGRRERIFNEWSASVGLLLKPQAANDDIVIALNLARASRYPSLEELYYFGPHPGNLAYEIGNDELAAEHALGFDLSVRARGARFEGEFSFFYNDITDYIFRQPTGEVQESFPVVRNIEVDSVMTGIEAHGDVKLTNEITVEVTYDMVRGELKDSGDPLPRIPPQRLCGPDLSEGRLPGRRQRADRLGSESRIRRGAADRRLCDREIVRVVFVHRPRRAEHDHGAAGQRGDTLYRNHLNYLKELLPEIGRSFKVVYSLGF